MLLDSKISQSIALILLWLLSNTGDQVEYFTTKNKFNYLEKIDFLYNFRKNCMTTTFMIWQTMGVMYYISLCKVDVSIYISRLGYDILWSYGCRYWSEGDTSICWISFQSVSFVNLQTMNAHHHKSQSYSLIARDLLQAVFRYLRFCNKNFTVNTVCCIHISFQLQM